MHMLKLTTFDDDAPIYIERGAISALRRFVDQDTNGEDASYTTVSMIGSTDFYEVKEAPEAIITACHGWITSVLE